eukprot:CAMPEP_0175986892 /NCGR_PEP_ID=MMETSP0108-20121206/50396_1 /TAXON_ID=195067 ORGANISM="Goniomonas pacifica, Strain CCMP1869" /NCGR_SAMPLE_ID=MMETSP0108 /ASSEMBLY_ACC=CAM_ASM_000204 /LENGTH=44 /DNA_ID= /DNA_START= /DNA_END= /DNA_ORIENTATION=
MNAATHLHDAKMAPPKPLQASPSPLHYGRDPTCQSPRPTVRPCQ